MDKIYEKIVPYLSTLHKTHFLYFYLILMGVSTLSFSYKNDFTQKKISQKKILKNKTSTTDLTNETTFQAHLTGWYPTEKSNLIKTIKQLDQQASLEFSATTTPNSIRAIIVPHAGYAYSGDVAAAMYRLISSLAIKHVILLAPSHRPTYNGIAVPTFNHYTTPLGLISVDQSTIKKLLKNPLFIINNHIYTIEHSLEVQLPFIQTYLPQATIVPLMVGNVSEKQIQKIAASLASSFNLTNPDTLIIVSSDFTHYGKSFGYTPFTDHIQRRIMQLDSGALQTIQQYSLNNFLTYIDQTGDTICGRNAIAVLLALIENKKLGLTNPHLIAYKTSVQAANQAHKPTQDQTTNHKTEHTINNKNDSSVSYVGMAFATPHDTIFNKKNNNTNKQPTAFSQTSKHAAPDFFTTKLSPNSFSTYEKNALLLLARNTLKQAFNINSKMPENLLYPILTKTNTAPTGVFVTLYKNGLLRGCIGQTSSQEPLYKTVITMTRAAAFDDSRFSPVTAEELPAITIAISILTQPRPVKGYTDIILGKDGIILTQGIKTALFLPKVATEFGWDLPTTLSELSKKAGLQPDAWKEGDTTYQLFNSIDFSEKVASMPLSNT